MNNHRHRRAPCGVSVSIIIAATLAVAAIMLGCGASPAEVSHVRGDAAGLVVLLETQGVGSAGDAMHQGVLRSLRDGGFTVVTDARAAHDVTASVDVNAVEESSLVSVKVNGNVRRSFSVTATLTMVADGRPIEQTSVRFSATDGDPVDEHAAALVVPITRSPRLHQFAQERRKQQADRSARQRREELEATQRRLADEQRQRQEAAAKEEAEWQEASAGGCAAAATLDACDKLRSWVEKNGANRRSAEARQILVEATPRLAALADELDWKKVDAARCRDPKAADDCATVETYSKAHPMGAHFVEAVDALRRSEKKIASLRAAEERRQEAEARAEEARLNREQEALEREEKKRNFTECQQRCRDTYCEAYIGTEKHPLCLARCTQQTCR